MEITVGKFTIKSDRFCFWVEETRKVDKTKQKKQRKSDGDETTNRVTGYHGNVDDLLEDFVDRRLVQSDAKDVEKVLREIAETQRAVKKIARQLAFMRKEPRKRNERVDRV